MQLFGIIMLKMRKFVISRVMMLWTNLLIRVVRTVNSKGLDSNLRGPVWSMF